MASNLPRITISVAHKQDGTDASGDLTSLSFGFGLFMTWQFVSIFGLQSVYGSSPILSGTTPLSDGMAAIIFNTHVFVFAISLLVISFTNQLLLKFYVGKPALIMATILAAGGTLAGIGVGSTGVALAVVSGVCTGMGAALMVALWGTAYARYEFNTIILNSIFAVVIGVVLFIVLTHWIPAPFSGILTSATAVGAAFLLWSLTPIPYFRRQVDIPIFHPLPVRTVAFFLRFGIPSFMFGLAASGVRHVCMFEICPNADLTGQLVIGAAACASIILVTAALAVSKDESHWDVIFRALVPVVAIGIFCLPLLNGPHALLASFAIACGFICCEALMWIFFSDLAQEFRLSPIFVFGLGRSLLVLGTIAGSAMIEFPLTSTNASAFISYEFALPLMLSLVIAYGILPRQREIRRIIDPSKLDHTELGYSALREKVVEDAASEGLDEASEQQVEMEAGARAKGRFHQKCEEIADRYLLSRRETEVMFLLAKGHNAAFIQDKLCISKSTAKTHINHIYRKLDIHTQQELLNMVEDREEDAKPAHMR